MSRRNWKHVQPRDLRDAMDLCLDYARIKHNRSIDSIADIMGLSSKWTLYKWVQEASMPARLIKSFQHACGIDFVTRWYVFSEGKLLIDIPKGRPGTPEDTHALQVANNEAFGELLKFYSENKDMDSTVAAIQTVLERWSWHKSNVEKCRQPEIPFDEE